MGTQKTRVTLQGTSSGNLNNPDNGIIGTNLDKIQAIELNSILDDLMESAFIKSSDDTDDITESADRKFLTVTTQDIDGGKTFTSQALFERGIGLKQLDSDSSWTYIQGNSALSTTYTIELPANTPAVGQQLGVKSYAGGIAELEWTSQGTGTIRTGIANRLAVYYNASTIDDTGVGSSTGTYIQLPSQSNKAFTIPQITPSGADFVLTEANQTLNGQKTFSETTIHQDGVRVDSSDSGYFEIKSTATLTPFTLDVQPIGTGGLFYTTSGGTTSFLDLGNVDATAGSFTSPLVIDGGELKARKASGTSPGVVTTDAQTFAGAKTFQASITVDGNVNIDSGNDLVFDTGSNTGVLSGANIAANYTLFMPTTSGTAGQVLSYGTGGQLEWINGGGGGSGTVNSGVTGRIPLYTSAGTTIDDTVSVGGNNITIQVDSHGQDTVYSIADAGASSAQILTTQGDQEVFANTYFHNVPKSAIDVSTDLDVNDYADFLQLIEESDIGVTINNLFRLKVHGDLFDGTAQGGSVYRMPTFTELGTSPVTADFIMDKGIQTIEGVKTFNGEPIFKDSFKIQNQSTSDSITITASPSGNYTITLPASQGTSGQVLANDGSGNLSWTTVASGTTDLDSLTDVTITGPSLNEALVYNGSQWVNQAIASGGALALNDLTDVDNNPTTASYSFLLTDNSSTTYKDARLFEFDASLELASANYKTVYTDVSDADSLNIRDLLGTTDFIGSFSVDLSDSGSPFNLAATTRYYVGIITPRFGSTFNTSHSPIVQLCTKTESAITDGQSIKLGVVNIPTPTTPSGDSLPADEIVTVLYIENTSGSPIDSSDFYLKLLYV